MKPLPLAMNEFIKEDVLADRRGFLCGVDEAGRGPLAGPVVAGAVVYSDKLLTLGINDSKKLTKNQRDDIYNKIVVTTNLVGVGIVWPNIIDEVNILEATFLAMKKAVKSVMAKCDGKDIELLLVDGPHKIKNFDDIEQMAVKQGDSKYICIGAASILAKVTRDNIMEGYGNLFGNFNFAKHKGYGTKGHVEEINSHGRLPIHRESFKLKSDKK